ncbi:MAG: DUF3500 domain-containing protein, partial [Acidobacteriota bacterium]
MAPPPRADAGRFKGTVVLQDEQNKDLVLDYAGLRVNQLNAKRKQLLLDLVGEYVGNIDSGHAKVKMSEVEAR